MHIKSIMYICHFIPKSPLTPMRDTNPGMSLRRMLKHSKVPWRLVASASGTEDPGSNPELGYQFLEQS
jgi:hypothetical protein